MRIFATIAWPTQLLLFSPPKKANTSIHSFTLDLRFDFFLLRRSLFSFFLSFFEHSLCECIQLCVAVLVINILYFKRASEKLTQTKSEENSMLRYQNKHSNALISTDRQTHTRTRTPKITTNLRIQHSSNTAHWQPQKININI